MSSSAQLRRILLLTQYYLPESGAPPVRLSAMVKELRKNGVEVEVLTGMPNYPTGVIQEGYRGRYKMQETIDATKVERRWLFPATGKAPLKRLFNYLSFTATATLPLILRSQQPDLVFVEAQPVTLAIPALLNRWLHGTPYVYNTPDLQVEHAGDDSWGVGLLVNAAKKLEAFLMQQALAVTTVTHAFIDHFEAERGMSRDKLTFLPNGADTDALRPQPADESLRQEFGVGDRTVFTYAGTHAPYQGLETIIEAAEYLRDRPDIVIVMVGKGPVRESLKEDVRRRRLDNVLFRDSPFDETARLMSITHASLIVLRPLPIAKKMRLSKTIPPLACGVPVIYAGWGESADLVEAHQAGITLPPQDPKALAQAMVRLADNPEERHAMGQRGRKLAEETLSWAFLVRDWLRQIAAVQRGQNPAVPAASTPA